MTLTLAEVEHIADLARLALSPEEKARYRQQLDAILEYAHRLQALDTQGILPTFSVLPPGLTAATPLRPDVSRPGLSTGTLLANAPAAQNGQFCVPPVLDHPDQENGG